MDTPSIVKKGVVKAEVNREVFMEDVIDAKLALMDTLESKGIRFSSAEAENDFYDNLSLFLEESFNWPDYRHHN